MMQMSYAQKHEEAAAMMHRYLSQQTGVTLIPEKFYVVTAGIYQSESEANAALASAQSFCADAYVKYSGDFQG